jgi:hypothetical protein
MSRLSQKAVVLWSSYAEAGFDAIGSIRYPQGTMRAIWTRLTDRPVPTAIARRPYWASRNTNLFRLDPGEKMDLLFSPLFESSPRWKYTRPIVAVDAILDDQDYADADTKN